MNAAIDPYGRAFQHALITGIVCGSLLLAVAYHLWCMFRRPNDTRDLHLKHWWCIECDTHLCHRDEDTLNQSVREHRFAHAREARDIFGEVGE